jgi:hypothetical protein
MRRFVGLTDGNYVTPPNDRRLIVREMDVYEFVFIHGSGRLNRQTSALVLQRSTTDHGRPSELYACTAIESWASGRAKLSSASIQCRDARCADGLADLPYSSAALDHAVRTHESRLENSRFTLSRRLSTASCIHWRSGLAGRYSTASSSAVKRFGPKRHGLIR